MLRRQKEEQERRQRDQQRTEAAMLVTEMEVDRMNAVAEDGDSSECEPGMKREAGETCEIREWRVHGEHEVPRLP